MVMNKKEQAEMERLREDLRIAKAFRFTDAVEPDLDPPQSFDNADAVRGWDFNSHGEGRVYKAMTTSMSSARDWLSEDRLSWSRGSVRLYSTKLLALKALRHEMETRMAKSLANIDKQIEAEVNDDPE